MLAAGFAERNDDVTGHEAARAIEQQHVAVADHGGQRDSVGQRMDDRYPSTDEEQAVHLDFPYPDVGRDLNRWLPLVKWLLAIPHYIVLLFLYIGVFFAVIAAWFAVLFTGRYPRGIFHFVEGVARWQNRVVGYAFILITDAYPPFRLAP